jgi:hypothetical protein
MSMAAPVTPDARLPVCRTAGAVPKNGDIGRHMRTVGPAFWLYGHEYESGRRDPGGRVCVGASLPDMLATNGGAAGVRPGFVQESAGGDPIGRPGRRERPRARAEAQDGAAGRRGRSSPFGHARLRTSGWRDSVRPIRQMSECASRSEMTMGDRAPPNRVHVEQADGGDMSRSDVSARIGRRGPRLRCGRVGGPIGSSTAGPPCQESGDGCPDPAFPGHLLASSVVGTST